MTLLNNIMTNTIHFSDSVHPLSTQEQTQVVWMLILLLYILQFSWIYILFTVQYSKLEQKLFAVFTVQCIKKIHYLC